MKTTFPFGASFFLPSKDFAKDLLEMKKMGFNVGRIEWPRIGEGNKKKILGRS